jgi:hypothetical protein
LPLHESAPGPKVVLTPNAISIFWACAKFENAAIVAQANDKTIAIRNVRFNRKPPSILFFNDWMQFKGSTLPFSRTLQEFTVPEDHAPRAYDNAK